MKLTPHCQDRLQNERPYIQLSWIEQVLADPIRREVQANGRIRFWGLVPHPDSDSRRFLRVVTLSDGDTGAYRFQRQPVPREDGMKLYYYPDTDSAYIRFSSQPGVETRAVADGLNVDLGPDGELVGIEMEHAAKHLDKASIAASQREQNRNP